jgi:hypothetical protein
MGGPERSNNYFNAHNNDLYVDDGEGEDDMQRLRPDDHRHAFAKDDTGCQGEDDDLLARLAIRN